MGKYSDDALRPQIEKNNRFESYCIYCGNFADTREHLPSKTFIDNTAREDYSIVPACKNCNEGFSQAETYLSCFADKLRNELSQNNIPLRHKTIATLKHDKKLEALLASQIYWKSEKLNVMFNQEDITLILVKLARGHIANLLDRVFDEDVFANCRFWFAPDFTETEILQFNEVAVMDKSGEVGSDFTQNLIFVEDIKNGHRYIICPWNEFESGNYRFIAYFDEHNFIVKIVVCETLFAIVTFPQ